MIIATLSRSIRRSALAEAVCGLTESSITSSIFRPMTPPAALTSSAASLMPMTAYSPSGPRKPVIGVRCPMRMASACALTIAGIPTAASSAEPAVLFSNARRDTLVIMTNPSPERFFNIGSALVEPIHSLRGTIATFYVTRMVARCETVVQWIFGAGDRRNGEIALRNRSDLRLRTFGR